jgi:phage terminase large subunit
VFRELARRYIPYGSNADLMAATDNEVLLSGAAGTGKSRACLEKIHAAMLQYPGARALIVRKTRSSLSQSGLFTFEKYVLGDGHPMTASGANRQFRQAYRYDNGSEIIVGGMDKTTAIMSTEYDLIYVQEAIELNEEEWESLTTRLRNYKMPYQQLLADTNPSFPQHWLKQRCDRQQTRLIFCRHEDNPRLYDHAKQAWTTEGEEYVFTVLDNLTGARKDRLRHGRWVQAEGVVYEDFDDSADGHVIDSFPIPKSWSRYRVIDFGFTNPFVCQWWAADEDGRLYLYREIYMSGVIVEDHATEIKRLSDGERYALTVADHDAEDRATLQRHGISTIAAVKDVSRGIQAVQARLRKAGDGRPRLFLFRDALVASDPKLEAKKKPVSTAQEFPGYIWAKTADGKPNKEEPYKIDDHGMDAMRYLVMAVDEGRKRRSDTW